MGVRDCVAHLGKGAGVTSPWNKLYGGIGATPLRGSAELDFNLWSLWEAFVGKGRRCPYCSHTGASPCHRRIPAPHLRGRERR